LGGDSTRAAVRASRTGELFRQGEVFGRSVELTSADGAIAGLEVHLNEPIEDLLAQQFRFTSLDTLEHQLRLTGVAALEQLARLADALGWTRKEPGQQAQGSALGPWAPAQ
jgi:hypothetical protein